MAADKRHYPGIELLRGFAAISVLIYHVIEFNNWKTFPSAFGLEWFKWGWAGVDLFYIISGFVITNAALDLRTASGLSEKEIFHKFMSRRIRRIAPLHYLTLALFTALFSGILAAPNYLFNLFSHLLFLHNFFPDFHRAINAPNWTLAVEMQFYLVLILSIRFITVANLGFFIAGSFLLAFLWRFMSFYLAGFLHPGSREHVFMLATQLPGMIDFFASGMLAAFFSRSNYFQTLGHKAGFRFLIFAIFAIIAVLAGLIFNSRKEDFWDLPWAVTFPRSLNAVAFSLLVTLFCLFELKPKMRKILAPFLYLGTISYGIYLYHFPIIHLMQDWQIPNLWKLVLTLTIAISAAALSWHFFEKRFLR